jgi:hypothetical protein
MLLNQPLKIARRQHIAQRLAASLHELPPKARDLIP